MERDIKCVAVEPLNFPGLLKRIRLLYNQKDQVVDFFVNVMKSTVWLLCSILYFHLAAK